MSQVLLPNAAFLDFDSNKTNTMKFCFVVTKTGILSSAVKMKQFPSVTSHPSASPKVRIGIDRLDFIRLVLLRSL